LDFGNLLGRPEW